MFPGGPGRVDVFYPSPSRELLQRFYDNGNWSGEVNLGGANVRHNLSACSWAPRRLDLSYNDPLTAVQHHWYQG